MRDDVVISAINRLDVKKWRTRKIGRRAVITLDGKSTDQTVLTASATIELSTTAGTGS